MSPRSEPTGVTAASYNKIRARLRAKRRFDEITLQLSIRRCAFNRILRTDRAASDKEARIAIHGIAGDSPPEKVQQIEIAVVGVHAGATKFDHFAAKGFVRRKIKFPLAVVSEICSRKLARLQSIRADNFVRGSFFDN